MLDFQYQGPLGLLL